MNTTDRKIEKIEFIFFNVRVDMSLNFETYGEFNDQNDPTFIPKILLLFSPWTNINCRKINLKK